MTNPRDGREVMTGRWQGLCAAVALAALCAGLTPACGNEATGESALDGGNEGGDADAGAGAADGGENSVDGGVGASDASDASTCAPPKAQCGTACLDTQTNVDNCGGCGVKCTATDGVPACVAGICTVGSCNAGFADCDLDPKNGCEVSTSSDPTQCGSCGNTCAVTNAVPACVSGKCTIATCNGGFGDCDKDPANGCEVNIGTNPLQCGACGSACSTANGTPSCAGGKCTLLSCGAGFADCDGNVPNGCEVNTANDPAQCGACGNVCVEANGTAGCANGICTIATCNAGFGDCNKSPADGCEVNTNTAPANCGACGNVCTAANGTAGCAAGACTVATCNPGFADCDGNPANGCEVNTNTTPTSCGACGTVCAVANATAGCAAGACTVATCNPGFADCDGNPANGCEVNTQTTPTSCGTCGNVCAVANGTAGCAGGACTLASCNPGFGDCDGNAATGCEVDTQMSATSCGACGNVCVTPNGVPMCVAGACMIASCNPGFADCDGNPANGCEVDTQTTATSCGACGNVCAVANGTAGCAAGACTIASCDPGFADCDVNPATGCEVDTQTSLTSCGACGNICSAANGTASCMGGTCGLVGCNAGFANCNGNPADGCEVDTTNDNGNCGACGASCSAACGGAGKFVSTTACVASNCKITACAAGHGDADLTCSDGCECTNSAVSNTCAGPTSLGTLSPGQTVKPSSNLYPQVPGVAYYAVTFTGNGSTSYAPTITLVDPLNEFVMDVLSSCAAAISCGMEGGSAIGVTMWGTSFTGFLPGNYNPIPPVGNNGTVIIKVYRKKPMTNCSNAYTLTVTN